MLFNKFDKVCNPLRNKMKRTRNLLLLSTCLLHFISAIYAVKKYFLAIFIKFIEKKWYVIIIGNDYTYHVFPINLVIIARIQWPLKEFGWLLRYNENQFFQIHKLFFRIYNISLTGSNKSCFFKTN